MIVKAKSNIIFKTTSVGIEKSDTQIKIIKQYWNEFIKYKKEIYNGSVYCVTNITNQKNETIFELYKTKFEDVVYAKKHSDLKINVLFVGTYFITVDGYYCIIKNNHNIVDLIGGIVDDTDFESGSFNAKKCLYREIKEELGIDIREKQNITKINLKYFKVPSKQEDNLANYPIGIIYETFLKITSNELEKEFKNNKSIIDGEIKELLLLKDFNILEHYKKKATYLVELFECIKNDNINKNVNNI